MASHKALSNWYAQVAQHLEAGMLLSDTFKACEGMPRLDRHALADHIETGAPFQQVLASAPKWLPHSDREFLVAGMETGSLPRTFQNLSERHASIGSSQTKLILGLVYPIGVLHITCLILPITHMIDFETGFDWNLSRFLIESASLILPIWLLIGLFLYLAHSDSPWLSRLLRLLPILRKYSRTQALADFAYSLGTFIAAGVPVPSAWRLSAKLINEAAFTRATQKLEPCFASGQDPAQELPNLKCFPPDFTAFYKTGAISGNLDNNLLTAGQHYQEQANRSLTLAALIYPSIIFAGVAGLVIYTIFKIFGGYLQIFDNFGI
jgi:type II secretory pathway component PulF